MTSVVQSTRGPDAVRVGSAAAGAACWDLRRNCALRPGQLVIALVALCLPCLLVALGFWWAGVPWVLPFAGVEVAAVVLALVHYARHARDGEWIAVDGDQVVWQRVRGQTVENGRADMCGLRVKEGREQGAAVELLARGRPLEFGRHAAPMVRDRFAAEFALTLTTRQAGREGAGSRI